ncbi:hypothetical protein [Streptomyces sp. NPDC051109]|uniref:hypothetical protein n=1 Tax=Streptomyces sp. NPDC051109 TaxID=3365642 RepID=UPI00378EC4B4
MAHIHDEGDAAVGGKGRDVPTNSAVEDLGLLGTQSGLERRSHRDAHVAGQRLADVLDHQHKQ